VPGCLACLTQNVLLRDVTALTAHDEDRLLEQLRIGRADEHGLFCDTLDHFDTSTRFAESIAGSPAS